MTIKKETWKTVIQLIITILTAIVSTCFTESCIKPHILGDSATPTVATTSYQLLTSADL